MPATPIKKLLSCEEKNLHKSAKKAKTKHLLWNMFIQSIFVIKAVKVSWVKTRGEKSLTSLLEVNRGFRARPKRLENFCNLFFCKINLFLGTF